MEQKIIGIAGKKQAGKNTLANFLCGLQLQWNGIIEDFDISEKGELWVRGVPVVVNGEELTDKTFRLDVAQNNDLGFARWAMDSMWPFVKNYSFAEALKETAIDLFEVPRNLVYGTDEDKNAVVEHLLWENMPGVVCDSEWWNWITPDGEPDFLVYHEPGPMTVREFLQFFGTEIGRKIYDSIWVNRCIKDIVSEGSYIAVISDCRFDNEVKAVQKQGGKVVGLTRDIYGDKHASENALDFSLCDAIIDNQKMPIKENCDAMIGVLKDWGWIQDFGPKEARGRATMKINSDKEVRNV